MNESPKPLNNEVLLAELRAKQEKLIQEELAIQSQTEEERNSDESLDALQHIADELGEIEKDIKRFGKSNA